MVAKRLGSTTFLVERGHEDKQTRNTTTTKGKPSRQNTKKGRGRERALDPMCIDRFRPYGPGVSGSDMVSS